MRYALFAGCVLLAAWGAFLVTSEPAAEAAGAGDEETLIRKSKVPAKIPEAARTRRNPVPTSARSLARGMELFQSQCAMCHGMQGKGNGDLAASLKFNMPDFTNAARKPTRTDGEIFYILTEGHGSMPAGGKRFEEEWRWDLVNHIRTLPN